MKSKTMNKFLHQAIYVGSYTSTNRSKTIGEKCKNNKMRNYFLSCYLLSQLRKTYHELSKNNINFLVFEAPDENKIIGLTKEEQEIINYKWTSGQLLNQDEYLKIAYDGNKRCHDFAKTRYKGTKLVNNGSYIQAADYSGDFYNVQGGIRKTLNQPEQYKYCIHTYGSCIARGFGVSDEFTISSYMQDSINQEFPQFIKVINYGTGGKAGFEGVINDIKYIQNTEFRENDIVILIVYNTFSSALYKRMLKNQYYECSELFNSPRTFGWWFLNSTVHLNAVGNKIISDYMIESVKEILIRLSDEDYSGASKTIKIAKRPSDYYSSNQKLSHYIRFIKQYKVKGKNKIGSIVMNCNPFTYGHKYLIEQALFMVEHLYIFVVEEDKSFFSFEDRIKMVKDGTKEFSNLTVLPSGQFMISSATFPEYFEKEEKQDLKIDATNDLRIFGEKIAPVLDIKTRFAGEEPIDIITRQYNNAMSAQLQSYGIEFICIPRLKHDDYYISASIVRSKMKIGEIDQLKELVPDTTYQMLKKYMVKQV